MTSLITEDTDSDLKKYIQTPSEKIESLLVDEKEFIKFLEWLPPLREDEAYEIVLMIRSTGLRDMYGFKGSDHKLQSKVVHGYLSERIPYVEGLPFRNIEHWRLRLYEDVKRLAIEAVKTDWFYIRYKEGTREVNEVLKVPPQLTALYISINPSNILKATLSTVKDILEATWTIAGSNKPIIKEIFRRPDERYHANIMKHTKTRFHTVDIDDQELSNKILQIITETLEYKPPTITTKRGKHILINLEELTKNNTINKWIGKQNKEIPPIIENYKKHHNEKDKEKLEEYIWNSNDPLYHRITTASIIYTDQKGAPIIEIKKKPLEPIPGTLYKGTTIKFTP